MDYNSNKSKGYMPIASGANMTGYYMGGSSSLMDMMQTGGQATRGGALLAQALQKQSDQRSLERAQRAEAERQKKGGLFGTVAGLGGGLLGAALAPLTGGASLALGAGLGTAAGTFLGESLGAGKSKKVDRSGTVYGQEQFRDVEQASRDYTKGKLERALASGGKAALSAYASPGGGIYGKVSRDVDPSGLLGKGRGFLTKTFTPNVPTDSFGNPLMSSVADTSIMDAYFSANPLTAGLQEGGEVKKGALMDAFKEADLNKALIMQQAKERILGDPKQQYFPESVAYLNQAGLLGMTEGMSKEELEDRAFLREQIKSRAGLDAMIYEPTLGIGDVAATESLSPQELRMDRSSLTDDISGLQAISMFTPPEQSTLNSPRFLRDVLGMVTNSRPLTTSIDVGPLTVLGGAAPGYNPGDSFPGYNPGGTFADGGLVEYQYGGGVGNIQSILNQAGMTTTPEQLALFEQFDDTALNQLAKGLQDNLLSGTQQAAQQQAGAGFAGSGAVQQAQAQQRERAMEDLTSAQEQAARDFESQTLGQAAQMIQEGAEFGGVREEPQFEQAPTEEAGWSPPQNPQQGATYAFNNQNWIWDGSNWVIGEQFTYDMDSYYDDLYG
jgi:hypothetical protein